MLRLCGVAEAKLSLEAQAWMWCCGTKTTQNIQHVDAHLGCGITEDKQQHVDVQFVSDLEGIQVLQRSDLVVHSRRNIAARVCSAGQWLCTRQAAARGCSTCQ